MAEKIEATLKQKGFDEEQILNNVQLILDDQNSTTIAKIMKAKTSLNEQHGTLKKEVDSKNVK